MVRVVSTSFIPDDERTEDLYGDGFPTSASWTASERLERRSNRKRRKRRKDKEEAQSLRSRGTRMV